MGFFDKLKSAANAITGGSATVGLECEQVTPGMPARVWVRATAESGLKIDGVYLLVRAREHARVRDTDYEQGRTRTETINATKQTFKTRVDLAGPQELPPGQEQTWEGEFTIPADANPTLHGQMIKHIWQIQAGLDAFGNDPDSGWQEIQVR